MMNEPQGNQDSEFDPSSYESATHEEYQNAAPDFEAGESADSERESCYSEDGDDSHQVHPKSEDIEASRQGNEVLSFVSAIENELNQLRSATLEQASYFEATQQLQREVESQRVELEQFREEIECEQQRLGTHECELEEREQVLNERSASLDHRHAELEEAKKSLDEGERHLKEWEDRLKEQQQSIRSEWDNFKGEREALHEDQRRLEEERREATEARSQFEKEVVAFEELKEQLEREREELDTARQQIEDDRAEISRDRQSLEEQLGQLIEEENRIGEMKREAEARKQECDRAQHDLDGRETGITQLEEQLQEQRSEIDRIKSEQEELAEELRKKEEEISSQRAAIQVAKDALARKKIALQSEREDFETERRAFEGKCNNENAESTDDNESRDVEAQEAQLARISELEEEVSKREDAIRTLSQHYRILQTELDEQRNSNADSPVDNVSTGKELSFLALRKKRLRKERQLLRKRFHNLASSDGPMPGQIEAVRELAQQRALLAEVRNELNDAEKRMVQQWAHAGAVTRMFLIVVSVLLLAGASYFSVMQFVPAQYVAKAVVSAQAARAGFPITAEQLHTWQAVNEKFATSDRVLKSTADRLSQRGYENLGSVDALQEYLDKSLSISSTADGMIEFSLIGKGQVDTRRLLETYSIAFVSASNSGSVKRTDGAKTKLTTPATVDPTPLKDNRLQVAGMAFGGSMLFLIPLGLLIYNRLRKVERVFDTTGDLFVSLADDQQWDSIRRSADGIVEEHVIE